MVAALVAVLVAAATCASAEPAAAAVPGLTRVSRRSATDASSPKNVIVACPSGKRVVGAGGDVVGGSGRALLDDLVVYSPTAVSVTAVSHSPPSTAWYHVAYAVCADPLPGQTYASALSASGPSNKVVTVSCPPGKRVVGAGGDLWDAHGAVLITAVRPNSTLTAVTVVGINRVLAAPPAPNWRVRAHAVCADPLPGLTLRSGTSSQSAATSHFVQPMCLGGSRLVGAGAEVVNSEGLAAINGTLPRPALDGVEVHGSYTGDAVPYFAVRGYAICATP